MSLAGGSLRTANRMHHVKPKWATDGRQKSFENDGFIQDFGAAPAITDRVLLRDAAASLCHCSGFGVAAGGEHEQGCRPRKLVIRHSSVGER